jgi:hypothetical protein
MATAPIAALIALLAFAAWATLPLWRARRAPPPDALDDTQALAAHLRALEEKGNRNAAPRTRR